MAAMKAVVVMAIWTALAIWGLNALDVGNHYREPLWALGTGVALLVIWMVNFWIFFRVAGEEPWDWLKG